MAITSRSQKAADKAVGELRKIGKGEIMGVEADVRDGASQQKAIDRVVAAMGRPGCAHCQRWCRVFRFY